MYKIFFYFFILYYVKYINLNIIYIYLHNFFTNKQNIFLMIIEKIYIFSFISYKYINNFLKYQKLKTCNL